MEMKENYRAFNVSEGIKPYLERVMQRDRIPYAFRENNMIETTLSGNAFHIAIEDALCEMERGDSRDIPVYSFRTITNPKKFRRLREINKMNSFKILSKDRAKYNRRIEGHR